VAGAEREGATVTSDETTSEGPARSPFGFAGINHLALVCRDMARTVDFYEGLLGMSLVKTIDLPEDMGQHFFFDCGGGNLLAFFWFPGAPSSPPGVAAPAARPDTGDITSAVSSMNHVALSVPEEALEPCRQRLLDAGVPCSVVVNHDDSEYGVSEEVHPGVFVRSVYFTDPDGILLELAATVRPFGPGEVRHEPETAVSSGVAQVARGA
jgi:catechol 2,3-dioxygenase-like lactoylglutathione lyase family enzyme